MGDYIANQTYISELVRYSGTWAEGTSDGRAVHFWEPEPNIGSYHDKAHQADLLAG